jgi:hypothetical protein
MSIVDARKRREALLDTPSNLGSNETKDVSAAPSLRFWQTCSRFTSRPRTSNGTYQVRISGITSRRAGRADLRDDGRNRG